MKTDNNNTVEPGANISPSRAPKLLVTSQTQIRAKVQSLLEDNMQQANGRFHCKELNEYGFLQDLFKKFILTPKQ